MKGYSKVIYSGFPTIELSNIIHKYILPNKQLNGIYHVSSYPISKYELINLIAKRYRKRIEIEEDNTKTLDRSLDSSLFKTQTGYTPPPWDRLIDEMYKEFINVNRSFNEGENETYR